MYFGAALLDMPLVTADPALHRVMDEYALERAARLPGESSLEDRCVGRSSRTSRPPAVLIDAETAARRECGDAPHSLLCVRLRETRGTCAPVGLRATSRRSGGASARASWRRCERAASRRTRRVCMMRGLIEPRRAMPSDTAEVHVFAAAPTREGAWRP